MTTSEPMSTGTATLARVGVDSLLSREIAHSSCPWCWPDRDHIVPGEVSYCGRRLDLDPTLHVCPDDESCGCLDCRLCQEPETCPTCGLSDEDCPDE